MDYGFSYNFYYDYDATLNKYLTGHIQVIFSNLGAHVNTGEYSLSEPLNPLPYDFGVNIVKADVDYKTRFTCYSETTPTLYYRLTALNTTAISTIPITMTLPKESTIIFDFGSPADWWADMSPIPSVLIMDFFTIADVETEIDTAYTGGYNTGYNTGYETGYNEGKLDTNPLSNGFDILTGAVEGFTDILNYQVLPNITIGHLVTIPVVITLLFTIFKILRD